MYTKRVLITIYLLGMTITDANANIIDSPSQANINNARSRPSRLHQDNELKPLANLSNTFSNDDEETHQSRHLLSPIHSS
jgi:hypothetical protein